MRQVRNRCFSPIGSLQAESTGYPMDGDRQYISAISYVEANQPSPLAKGCWLCCAFEQCKGRTNESVNAENIVGENDEDED